MSIGNTVMAVVPARGGSKGIPRKNLRLLNQKPLIAHTLEQAKASTRINRLVVSTDDDEITRFALSVGVDVPFSRPMDLASDQASQVDVLIHTMKYVEEIEQKKYDIVLLLQPTAPLRLVDDIDQSLDLLFQSKADTVISLFQVGNTHPYYMYTLEGNYPQRLLQESETVHRRQDFPLVYVRNGAIYATRWDIVKEKHTLYGDAVVAYVMPQERSINIDTEFDLFIAESLLKYQLNLKPEHD